nr:hypothetical protein BgiMline_016823 [Biomphalaria glabrata]
MDFSYQFPEFHILCDTCPFLPNYQYRPPTQCRPRSSTQFTESTKDVLLSQDYSGISITCRSLQPDLQQSISLVSCLLLQVLTSALHHQCGTGYLATKKKTFKTCQC